MSTTETWYFLQITKLLHYFDGFLKRNYLWKLLLIEFLNYDNEENHLNLKIIFI